MYSRNSKKQKTFQSEYLKLYNLRTNDKYIPISIIQTFAVEYTHFNQQTLLTFKHKRFLINSSSTYITGMWFAMLLLFRLLSS